MKKNNIIIISLLLLLTIIVAGINYTNQIGALFAEGDTPNPGHALNQIGGHSDLATKVYVNNALSGISESKWTVSEGNIYRSSGNVGIGIASPSQKLHVGGNTRIDGSIYDASNNIIYNNTTKKIEASRLPSLSSIEGYSDLATKVYVNNALSGISESKWTVSEGNIYRSSGNVGIGIASPSQKLHVGGNTRIDGSIYDASNNIIYNNTTKKIEASRLPFEQGDITSDHSTNTWAGGYYNVANLTPDNIKQGTLFGRGQIGNYSCSTCPACDSCCPTPQILYLYENVHTEEQCISAGGGVFNTSNGRICQFTASSCPSGWTQRLNWSITKPTCIGLKVCTSKGQIDYPNVFCTNSHSWSNTVSETRQYCTRTCGGIVCSGDTDGGCPACSGTPQYSTITASTIAIGCY